ncbi:MAG: sigma-70 family RNA polymerase sigma factor [Opitutaceae bacterium]|nr:sigma-70 family RNA polymerase sigma factor [Opitutaceae bacterium]
MCTDAELLQRYVRDREEAAFSELVGRHLPVVYAAALRRAAGRAELAEDAAQQVFCDLARKSATLMHHDSLIGWLYRSVRYAVIDALRADVRRQRLVQRAAQEVVGMPEDNPPDWEELRPWLDAAMDDLRAGDREIVLMRYFYDLSYREIGERLGVPENTARMRTERGLDRLRALLARRGVRSSAAALVVALGHEACASAPAGVSLAVTQAALAVGPAHGAGAVLMTFLMAKYTIPVLSGLVAAGVTAVVWTASSERVSAEELAALRAERDQLQSQHAEAGSGSAVAAVPAAATAATPVSTTPVSTSATAISTEPTAASPYPATQGEVTARGHSNHGTATPMDAAMTFAWACDIADPVELERLITFDADGRAAALEELARMPEEVRTQFSTPEALYGMLMAGSCLEAPPPGADMMRQFITMVELTPDRYASRKKGSDRNFHEYQRTEAGWKYVIPVAGVRGLPGILKSDTLARLSARASAPAQTATPAP